MSTWMQSVFFYLNAQKCALSRKFSIYTKAEKTLFPISELEDFWNCKRYFQFLHSTIISILLVRRTEFGVIVFEIIIIFFFLSFITILVTWRCQNISFRQHAIDHNTIVKIQEIFINNFSFRAKIFDFY